VGELMVKNNTATMPQPQYSLDMVPCEFFLFLKMRRILKSHRFKTIDKIKSASLKELRLFQTLSLISVSMVGRSYDTSAS